MGKPPFTQEFQLPHGLTTSVVLEQEDFDAFCDDLKDTIPDESIATIREEKHVPQMTRGANTEQFFERWSVTTETLSIIVRGHGRTLLEDLLR